MERKCRNMRAEISLHFVAGRRLSRMAAFPDRRDHDQGS